MENNLTECGGVRVNQVCYCGEVAVIMCKLTGKQHFGFKSNIANICTIFNYSVNVTQSPTTAITSGNGISASIDNVSTPTTTFTFTTTVDSVSPTTTPQDDNTTSINNTVLGAVIGVLVALVAIVLITVVCIVVGYMRKKKSAKHQQRYINIKQYNMHALQQ